MQRVNPRHLKSFAAGIMRAVGAPDATAADIADSLVGADLRGHASHGVLRLDYYRGFVEEGVIDPEATPTVVKDEGSTVQLDGRNAFGQVVGREIAAQLVARTKAHGVASVGVRDATHIGRVGEWAERVAREGYAVIGFVNTQGGGQRVAPAGSASRRLSTNPITVGFPTFDALPHDIILDIATSQVAHGKLRERSHSGEAIPEGWAVDADGNDVTDVEQFYEDEAAIRPLGGTVSGYKGFGLGVVAELIAGCLGGGDVAGMANPDHSNNAAGFLAVDLERFLPPAAIERRVSAFADHLDSSDNVVSAGDGAKGQNPQIPGAPEYDALTRNREAGVPVDDRLAISLSELGEQLSVEPPAALRDESA